MNGTIYSQCTLNIVCYSYVPIESSVSHIIGQLHELQVAVATKVNILRDVLKSHMDGTVSCFCNYTGKTLLVKMLSMAVHTHNVSC